MRNILLVFCFPLFMISCSTQNTKEKLIGEWAMVSVQFVDPKKAPEKLMNPEFVKSEVVSAGYSISFDENSRYRMFEHGVEDQPHDRMFFKITDENLVESINGDFFEIYMYEDNGSLYEGGNIPGPFKIIELSKNKLVLQNQETRYKTKHYGEEITPKIEEIIIEEENILIVYERK